MLIIFKPIKTDQNQDPNENTVLSQWSYRLLKNLKLTLKLESILTLFIHYINLNQDQDNHTIWLPIFKNYKEQ